MWGAGPTPHQAFLDILHLGHPSACDLRLVTMVEAREACDAAEAVVPSKQWPMATYKDLLFLDYTR